MISKLVVYGEPFSYKEYIRLTQRWWLGNLGRALAAAGLCAAADGPMPRFDSEPGWPLMLRRQASKLVLP